MKRFRVRQTYNGEHYDEYVSAPDAEHITKTLFKDREYFARVTEFFGIQEYPAELETEIDLVEHLN